MAIYAEFLKEKSHIMQTAKKMFFVITAACGITACASENAHIYPISIIGQRIVGNESYVTITNVWNEMDALPLAEKHCKQHGKTARFYKMEGARAIFDCIKS